jgi:hypothetical protein
MYFPIVLKPDKVTYFASSTSASIPEASGAADEVPLNVLVHLWLRPVVIYQVEDTSLQQIMRELRRVDRVDWAEET